MERTGNNVENLKKSKNTSSVTLREWLMGYFESDELETLFTNMDSAMKYIHSKGYCIYSFNPKDIEILNDSLSQIRFNALAEMPSDMMEKKNIVREDIYKSSFLQIGIYTKCLNYLNPDFLKANFAEFAQFLPEGNVPYYRGVIERNASVYLGDFLSEKRKRDLAALEKEIGDSSFGAQDGKQLVKSNGVGALLEYDSMNTKVNDSIYKQLNGSRDAAYISFLMVPALVAILGVIFAILVLLFK